MSNRKVLLVSYYFPPLGGAGIARPLSLFQHLGRFGFDCDVLTVKPVLYRAYEPELMNELDKSRIFRSGTYDPSRISYLLGLRNVSTSTADKSRIFSNRVFPDGKAGWIGPAVRFANKLCQRNKYDLIVSTSPPVSAHMIAMRLAHKCQVPWVADFQDYWVSLKAEEHFKSQQNIAKAGELLNEIKSNAKKIMAVNQSCGEYVGADEIIPICYDSNLVKEWRQPTETESFTIGVFGTISELTPIEPLLKVLNHLRQSHSDIYEKLKVIQLGLVDRSWIEEQLNRYQMRDKFELLSYQPRKQMMATLSRASLFYLGISAEQGKGITPSRLFTLLGSGRPVISYSQSGSEIDRILNKCGGCMRFDNGSIEQASEFLNEKFLEFEKGAKHFEIEPDYAREFSSEQMVVKFAGVFDAVIDS